MEPVEVAPIQPMWFLAEQPCGNILSLLREKDLYCFDLILMKATTKQQAEANWNDIMMKRIYYKVDIVDLTGVVQSMINSGVMGGFPESYSVLNRVVDEVAYILPFLCTAEIKIFLQSTAGYTITEALAMAAELSYGSVSVQNDIKRTLLRSNYPSISTITYGVYKDRTQFPRPVPRDGTNRMDLSYEQEEKNSRVPSVPIGLYTISPPTEAVSPLSGVVTRSKGRRAAAKTVAGKIHKEKRNRKQK